MKKKIVLIMLVVVSLMAGNAMAIVIQDASFEEAGAGVASGDWAQVRNLTTPWAARRIGGHAWVGNNYDGVAGHTGDSWVDLNGSVVSQSLTDTYVEGVTYTLSIWATATTAGEEIELHFTNGTGNNGWTGADFAYGASSSGRISVTQQASAAIWEQYSFDYTAVASDAGENIGFGIQQWTTGDIWVDDVAVTVGNTVVISETLGSTEVDEGGATDSYDIVLDSSPTSDVQVTVTPGDSQIDIGSGSGVARVLTFTSDPSGNWDIPQTITVTAYDDTVFEPDDDPHITIITHTCQSVDSGYDDIPVNSVSVEVNDNDLGCGSWGYLRSDINKDCYVNLLDLELLAVKWLFPPS